jgi:hypothetical protein
VGSSKTSDKQFDECVILSKEAFDPGAVFLDDIVDDDVLPNLSLRVDGLTQGRADRTGEFELLPEDLEPAEPVPTDIPRPDLDPQHLEVYGWESSLWRKLKSYLGF